jgi:hypothetical protein
MILWIVGTDRPPLNVQNSMKITSNGRVPLFSSVYQRDRADRSPGSSEDSRLWRFADFQYTVDRYEMPESPKHPTLIYILQIFRILFT